MIKNVKVFKHRDLKTREYNVQLGFMFYSNNAPCKGIRIVLSPEEFYEVTEEDVVDMDSLDPLIMQTVKYATALVHAFIILQTDSKLPKWLNEELEGHRALNMLEG